MAKEIRPRFYGDESHDANEWMPIVQRIRQMGIAEAKKLLSEAELSESNKIEYNSKDETLSSRGEQIKTLDQLLDQGDVDIEKWRVDKYVENKWDVHAKTKEPKIAPDGKVYFSSKFIRETNFQVKAWLKRRGLEEPDTSWTEKWLKEVTDGLTLPDKAYKNYDGKPVVVAIGDLHIGAVTEDAKVVPDYNKEVCLESLSKVVSIVNNEYAGRPVHYLVGGDLIESFTGKNHKDTWKAIELHGSKAAMEAFKALRDLFMATDGFEEALLISGNHDRISSDNKDDTDGQVVELLHDIFQETTNIKTTYDPLILSKEIDGIRYIMDHGDKNIKKRSAEQIVMDYGDSTRFNMIVEFHDHHRVLEEDTYKVRRMICPSIVKSTAFSQRGGMNSRSGFVIFESNETGSADFRNFDL